jgi:predicted nucleic acid-binding protein
MKTPREYMLAAAIAADGNPIGAHDLIVAATAKSHGLSVLTQNLAEFSRVPGLSVISFSR